LEALRPQNPAPLAAAGVRGEQTNQLPKLDHNDKNN
jgi:hypothetical protein